MDESKNLLNRNIELERKKLSLKIQLVDVTLDPHRKDEKERLEKEIKLLSFEQTMNKQTIQKKMYYKEHRDAIREKSKENYRKQKDRKAVSDSLEISDDIVISAMRKGIL